MKKWTTVLLALTLSVTLFGCKEQTQPTTEGTSTPSASTQGTTVPTQPTTPTVTIPPQQDPVKPMVRPMHQLGSFDQIVGWYQFTYPENGRYPQSVTAVNLAGVVQGSYQLEFDEEGVPQRLLMCKADGTATGQAAQLRCDEKGNIVEVGIYGEDGQQQGSYLLQYDDTGRMVQTTMQLGDMSAELYYDQRYCVTRVVTEQNGNRMETELAHDADYKLIKRLRKDAQGNLYEGFAENYDASGKLRQRQEYAEGILVRDLQYNEQGCLTSEIRLQKTENGILSMQEIYTYDAQNRVLRIERMENNALKSWQEMRYEGEGCRTTVYDAVEGFLEEYYRERDEQGNIIKEIYYDAQGNVLSHGEYGFDVNGNQIKEHIFDENGLRIGYDWVYDAQGYLVKETEYVRGEKHVFKDYLPGREEPYRMEQRDAEGQLVYCYEESYDPAGKLTQCERWWADHRQVEQYNAQGKLAQIRKYDQQDQLTREENYAYHSNGQLSSMSAVENSVQVEVKKYDDHGNLIAAVYHNENGVLQWQEKYGYTYDAEDNLLTKTWLNRLEQPTRMEEYDADGQTLGITYYDAEGGVYIRISRTYQEQDGMLEVHQLVFSGTGRMLFDIISLFHTDTGHMHSITVKNGVNTVVYDQQLDLEKREYVLQEQYTVAESDFCKNYMLILHEHTSEGERPLLQLMDSGSCEAITMDAWGNPTTQRVYSDDGILQKDLAWAYVYYPSGQIQKLTAAENGNVTHISEYDEAGILVRETVFYGPGLWRITEYDEKGLEKISTDYNDDGTVSGKWVYERYDNELIKIRWGYYGSGALKEYAEYSEEGVPKTWKRYYEDGSLMWEAFYSRYGMLVRALSYEQNGMWAETLYNELEQEYRILTYDENNNLLMRTEYIYDAYGRSIREEHYDGNGVLQDYAVYTYRGSSQMLQSAIVYDSNGSVVQETYFDEQGNPII